jgi:chromosome segregation ATPase
MVSKKVLFISAITTISLTYIPLQGITTQTQINRQKHQTLQAIKDQDWTTARNIIALLEKEGSATRGVVKDLKVALLQAQTKFEQAKRAQAELRVAETIQKAEVDVQRLKREAQEEQTRITKQYEKQLAHEKEAQKAFNEWLQQARSESERKFRSLNVKFDTIFQHQQEELEKRKKVESALQETLQAKDTHLKTLENIVAQKQKTIDQLLEQNKQCALHGASTPETLSQMEQSYKSSIQLLKKELDEANAHLKEVYEEITEHSDLTGEFQEKIATLSAIKDGYATALTAITEKSAQELERMSPAQLLSLLKEAASKVSPKNMQALSQQLKDAERALADARKTKEELEKRVAQLLKIKAEDDKHIAKIEKLGNQFGEDLLAATQENERLENEVKKQKLFVKNLQDHTDGLLKTIEKARTLAVSLDKATSEKERIEGIKQLLELLPHMADRSFTVMSEYKE